jgi:hypothetical protein
MLKCFKVMPLIVLSARMRLLLRSASGIGEGRKRQLTARKP